MAHVRPAPKLLSKSVRAPAAAPVTRVDEQHFSVSPPLQRVLVPTKTPLSATSPPSLSSTPTTASAAASDGSDFALITCSGRDGKSTESAACRAFIDSGTVAAVVKQLKDGTDEQKSILRDYLAMIQSLMTVSLTPSEVKYFMYHSTVTTLDTTTIFAAGAYRFPLDNGLLSMAQGSDNGQRIGLRIALKHLDVEVNVTAIQDFQNAAVGVNCRFYPVKFALWRQKVGVATLGACDITAYGTSKSPFNSQGSFYWDPFDTQPRTGVTLGEDTALAAVHNPNPLSKYNNICEHEHVWMPIAPASVVTAAAGVATGWQNQTGDSRHSPLIRMSKTWHKGLDIGYNAAGAAQPVLNTMYFCALTDKPPAASTVTMLRYQYHIISHAYYTDS